MNFFYHFFIFLLSKVKPNGKHNRNHIVYHNRKHIVKRIGNHNGEIHNNEGEVRTWNMLQEQLTPLR